MNVWEVTFEQRWSYMEKGVFDTEAPECVTVVADSYDGALETARQVAMSGVFEDDENPGRIHVVKEVRLIEIRRGQSIDAIAKMQAA